MRFFENRHKKQEHFLHCIPVKTHYSLIQRGNVIYLVFKGHRPFQRLITWLLQKYISTDAKLDRFFERAWQLIDGSNSCYKIGQLLLQEFGQDCQPVYERLCIYLRYLQKRGWIKLRLSKKDKHRTISQ